MNSNNQAQHTIAFLRMAALQVRRMIERDASGWGDHDIIELRHIAAQCDREADELAARTGESDAE